MTEGVITSIFLLNSLWKLSHKEKPPPPKKWGRMGGIIWRFWNENKVNIYLGQWELEHQWELADDFSLDYHPFDRFDDYYTPYFFLPPVACDCRYYYNTLYSFPDNCVAVVSKLEYLNYFYLRCFTDLLDHPIFGCYCTDFVLSSSFSSDTSRS